MFPINFNFPYRKKDGSLITMEKALDGAGADLDLIDLDDVAITDPAEGDGLIYDNTAHKWKNIPIISRILTLFNGWKKNGAYNLACGVFTSKVENGTTYSANSDGSVSVSGEATGSNITSSEFTLKAGTYLVGFNPIPMSGGVSTDATNFTILDSSNNHLTGLPLNDDTSKVITVAADTVVKIRLYVYANSSGHTTNTTFYPVITTDLNATVADYAPGAKTNRELTEKLDELYGTDAVYAGGQYTYSSSITSIATICQTLLNDIPVTTGLYTNINVLVKTNAVWKITGYVNDSKTVASLLCMRYDGLLNFFYRSGGTDTVKTVTLS